MSEIKSTHTVSITHFDEFNGRAATVHSPCIIAENQTDVDEDEIRIIRFVPTVVLKCTVKPK